MVYAFLFFLRDRARVDANEARAPRPRASDAARSASRFAAAPRRQGRVGWLPAAGALSGPGFAGQLRRGQSWLYKSVTTSTFRRLPAAQRL